ncbi:MAG: thioredoxin family protein [Armatimonadetes bacterium]|nr:thioredoxin family protein [Akkermansiaceae bacterium]
MRCLLFFILLTTFLYAEKVSSVASLISEQTAIAPGKPFTLALKLEHPEGWHSYYKNSGGVELPPEIEWKLPEGSTVAPIKWPTPEVKAGFGGKSFIYPGSPVFLIEITPPASLAIGGTFTFRARTKWQICQRSCINESADFSIKLPIANNPTMDPGQAGFFAEARKKIPASAPTSFNLSATGSAKDNISIKISLPKNAAPPSEFIPNQNYIKPLSDGGKITTTADGILLILQRRKTDILDASIPQGNIVSGILVGDNNLAVPETNISSPPPAPISFMELLPILGGMFIGGLILNLMPCVFPVIGLKIMGFVKQAGENRRSIALHGITFALGVFASFAVLSGILFVVRAAAMRTGGDPTGWGFQLQDPWVVLVLLLLMFILAMNMFGLFEIGTSATSAGGNLQSKAGHAGSFFSGVLATIVATPCSAPFLGAALAAAVALPTLQFFSAFAAMASGLAFPYLVLSFFPRLVDMLPKPGPWMESFKQAMSFLLFATAGFLLWVYSGLIGQEYLLAPIFGLSLIAAAAWIYGRWYLPYKPRGTRAAALAITTLFAISGVVLALPPKPNDLWKPWSEETVEKLLSNGTPVYIDFTAQWCLTCQINKKVAYTDEVIALAKRKNITFLKADKTRTNPAIENKLQELGRTAIPVNVLLIPDKEPVITPEVLTPGILTELFNRIP